jgi:hypothetical protein
VSQRTTIFDQGVTTTQPGCRGGSTSSKEAENLFPSAELHLTHITRAVSHIRGLPPIHINRGQYIQTEAVKACRQDDIIFSTGDTPQRAIMRWRHMSHGLTLPPGVRGHEVAWVVASPKHNRLPALELVHTVLLD